MNNDERIAPKDLADMQALVTSGFGNLLWSAYLFIEFREGEAARALVRALLPKMTTAADWPFERLRESDRGLPGVLNVALTSPGLKALGLSERALETFPEDFRDGAGSAERARILGDREADAPENWEFGGPGGATLHAMLLTHAATRADREVCVGALRSEIDRLAPGITEHRELSQEGGLLDGHKEHFGFRDGIGQPRILGLGREREGAVQAGEFVLGYRNEYGFYPPVPVVEAAEDPGGILPPSLNPHHAGLGYRDFGRNGSFLAYRKLEQDVAGFWGYLRRESERVRGSVDARFAVWLASRMVGRWPNGTPLALSPEGDRPPQDLDAFGYAQDPSGLACPVGAHIRRSNPRDHLRPAEEAESRRMTARHRLLRRGRIYGDPLFPLTALDDANDEERLRAAVECADDGAARGVHFLCINASIKGQFEFVQQAWVNNPRFNGLVDNPDPLAGTPDGGAAGEAGRGTHTVPGCPAGIQTSNLPRFVTVRGGVYAFLPSLTALRYLAQAG